MHTSTILWGHREPITLVVAHRHPVGTTKYTKRHNANDRAGPANGLGKRMHASNSDSATHPSHATNPQPTSGGGKLLLPARHAHVGKAMLASAASSLAVPHALLAGSLTLCR